MAGAGGVGGAGIGVSVGVGVGACTGTGGGGCSRGAGGGAGEPAAETERPGTLASKTTSAATAAQVPPRRIHRASMTSPPSSSRSIRLPSGDRRRAKAGTGSPVRPSTTQLATEARQAASSLPRPVERAAHWSAAISESTFRRFLALLRIFVPHRNANRACCSPAPRSPSPVLGEASSGPIPPCTPRGGVVVPTTRGGWGTGFWGWGLGLIG